MSCSCCSHDEKTTIFEPFIDRFVLLTHCRLDNGRTKPFSNPHIGRQTNEWHGSKLQSLPIELYQACLSYLDLATLTAMRRVSQYTRLAIESLYQYQELYEHAPQALRACLSTGVSPHIPLRRLHHALTTMECYYCRTSDNPRSTFGSYLSLYEGRRICLFCLRNNELLKPVELMTLITLRCQKNSTLCSTPTSLPIVTTLPGHYSPIPSAAPRSPRTSLLLAYSITSTPEQTNEKERLALFGNSRTATTYHHPLISPSDESDISPTANYIPPETPKQIAHLYMSAISFPYLPSSKSCVDYGVLCGDCNLHVRYEEHRWKEEQRNRRMNGQDPTASLRTRERINKLRKKACKMYTVSEAALKDVCNRQDVLRKWEEDVPEMSIQEHKLFHAKEKISKIEVQWRKSVKGPPLPLLKHDRFG